MTWVSMRSLPAAYHLGKLKAGYQFIENSEGKPISLSPRQRLAVGYLVRAMNLPRFLHRKALGVMASAEAPDAPRLEDAYAFDKAMPGADAAIAVCERQLAIYADFLDRGVHALVERGIPPKPYLAEVAKTAKDPLKHVPFLYDPEAASALVEFGLQSRVVSSVSAHLGVLPILSGLRILYSPNEQTEKLTSAQLFHIDPEGARQVKLFMAIRKVKRANSPFTFIPKALTAKLLALGGVYQANRVTDKHMFRAVKPASLVEHTGKPGDAVLIDTSQCFHFGSRPSAEPRALLYYSFHDPFSSFHALRYQHEKAARRWDFFTRKPHRFTDYLLSRKM